MEACKLTASVHVGIWGFVCRDSVFFYPALVDEVTKDHVLRINIKGR